MSSVQSLLPPSVIDQIKAIPIPVIEQEDSYYWGYLLEGIFFFKTAARAIQDTPLARSFFQESLASSMYSTCKVFYVVLSP